jgi:hypothetical protein
MPPFDPEIAVRSKTQNVGCRSVARLFQKHRMTGEIEAENGNRSH